jgi:hypothetical protein
MAVALIAHASVANGTTSAIDTTGATLLVAWDGSATPSAPTDSKSNSWTGLGVSVGASGFGGFAQAFYVANPTVGSGHTFTSTSSFSGLSIAAFSGVTTSSPFDVQQTAGSGGVGAFTLTSVNTTANGDLIVTGGCGLDTTLANISIDSSLTILEYIAQQAGITYGTMIAWGTLASAGAIGPRWSWAAGSDTNAVTLASFFASVTAPTDLSWLKPVGRSLVDYRPSILPLPPIGG